MRIVDILRASVDNDTIDGVVKSPISFVAGFSQNLNMPHVLLRA